MALIKSWVLWTGVTLGTRFTRLGRWSAAAMIAWFAAALAATGLLVGERLPATGDVDLPAPDTFSRR